MHSEQNKIRVWGQRSIPSSFIFRSSNTSSKDSNQDGQKEDSKKNPCISFSNFLDKKLHKNSVLPKTVKGKSRPFCSPLGPSNDGWSTDHQIGVQKKEEERSSVLDHLVFEQFIPTATSVEKGDDIVSVVDGDKGDCMGPFGEKRTSSSSFGIASSGDGDFGSSTTSFVLGSSHVGVGTSTVNDVPGSRKRRNLFGGGGQKHTTRKHSLVLGGHPNPNQEGRKEKGNKKQRPLYNHYANGSGFWDCDMEGVDSEEVGFGEIWEGVGSTTFGGIEWH